MLKPNASIVRELKAYDKDLSVKWNNEMRYWEIWYKRPTGKKLITPIVESIYVDGGDTEKFFPLDMRIIDWLYWADSKRVDKNWKWICRKRYDERLQRRREKARQKFQNFAKDSYVYFNNGFINPLINETNWTRPDCQSSCKSRVMMRSGDNAKKARGEK